MPVSSAQLMYITSWMTSNTSAATTLDLKARLDQVEVELLQAKADNFRMSRELFECKSELKQERFLNKIAVTYIPEDQRDEYALELPNRQLVWTGSSPVSIIYQRLSQLLTRQMNQVKGSI